MRRLLLIRHGKSSWDNPQLEDHNRPLNKRGERDAPLMAQRLLDHGEQLDAIFSSTAIRALGIAQPISLSLNIPLVPKPALYTFSDKCLWEQLLQLPDHHQNVAIVSHNPAITSIANTLIETSIDNIPTSGIVAYNCMVSQWRKLHPTYCKMDYFDYPKKQKAVPNEAPTL